MKEINDEAYLKAYAKTLDIIFEKILLPNNKNVTTNISRKDNKDESFNDISLTFSISHSM